MRLVRRIAAALFGSIAVPALALAATIGGTYYATQYDFREFWAATDGKQFQVAFLLRATPLHALEELGKTKEVMPQKSTFFFPKLATGMVVNPIR